jgi:hypothetical protein
MTRPRQGAGTAGADTFSRVPTGESFPGPIGAGRPGTRARVGDTLARPREEDLVSGTFADTVFVISSDTFGRGSEDLGRQLMAKFVLQLSTQSPKPHAIAFYNAGVKLLAEGSPCVEGFRSLEHGGTDLLACGTCVDGFQLRGHVAVGHVTDMRDILAAVHAAPKVVAV